MNPTPSIQPETPRRLRDKLIEAELRASVYHVPEDMLTHHLALIQDELRLRADRTNQNGATRRRPSDDPLVQLTRQDDTATLVLRRRVLDDELQRRNRYEDLT